MILVKTSQEIYYMRRAGQIVAECHAMLAERIRPGITPVQLDEWVENQILSSGATPGFKGYQGFPASICTAVNDVVCHGIPGNVPLQSGDVITIDIGTIHQGYYGDSAWTYAVGEVEPKIAELLTVGRKCLDLGIEQAVPGKRIGAIGHAIQAYAEKLGFGVVREYCGHGVGKSLWEEPTVPHFGKVTSGALMKAGMTIAIEPMITTGGWKTTVDPDQWTARTADGSICVQYEHSIVITDHGPEILTQL